MAQGQWRLAFMFDAPDGDLELLEGRLRQARDQICAAAQGHPVRLGVALPRNLAESDENAEYLARWRSVDGAIEVTIANDGQTAVPAICQAMRPILDRLAVPGSIEVMTGPVYYMVPIRRGGVFLSLAFRRYPGTTVEQFRNWWFNQHAKIAIPVLGPGLLAYDQVHVEEGASREAAAALGAPFVDYDAYDNLTWCDPEAYVASTSDADGMARVLADETGRIDNDSRRYALMREID